MMLWGNYFLEFNFNRFIRTGNRFEIRFFVESEHPCKHRIRKCSDMRVVRFHCFVEARSGIQLGTKRGFVFIIPIARECGAISKLKSGPKFPQIAG